MYVMFYDGTIWRRINDVKNFYINGKPFKDVINNLNDVISTYNHITIIYKDSQMFIPVNKFILQVVGNEVI